MEEIKASLNKVSLIDNSDWEMMEHFLIKKKIEKNEFFLKAGKVNKYIGFVKKGSFRWFYIDNKGGELNYHFFFKDSFMVDYQSFISQEPGTMYIQAMEESEIVLLAPRDKIFEFYEKSHHWSELGRKISQMMYVFTARRVESLLFNSAEERYLLLLKQWPDIFQRVSLAHISSYIGIKGPSLSRIRRRLSI